MAGAGLTITVDAAELQAGLARLADAVVAMRPVLDLIGGDLERSTRDRFERQTGPDGVAWVQSVRAREEGGWTLVDTGRLRSSITHTASDVDLMVGSNVVYAAIHQFGGVIKQPERTVTIWRRFGPDGVEPKFVKQNKRNRNSKRVIETEHAMAAREVTMPARPFLGLDQADRDDITATIVAWLDQAAGGRAVA